MEESKFLDTTDHPQTLKKIFVHSRVLFFSLFVCLCLLLFLYGCHFPKIIVLKDPLTPEEHLNLGVAYEKNGELDNAIREYQAGAKKLPIAYLYLGNAYFRKNELDEAEKFYKKAIADGLNHADAYNNLAWLYYMKRKKLDEAENLALKAINVNPDKEDIYRDTLDKIRKLKKF